MTDINLKDFDKNNWDEFVHKRVLDSVIQQENATNKEQDDNIATNKADIATNKQGIADNKTAIDANKADIATNKQGIADNKTAIDDLENKAILKDATKTSVDQILNNVNVNGNQSMGSVVKITQISFPDFNANVHQVSDLLLSFMGSTLLNDDKQIVLTYDEIKQLDEFTGTGTIYVNGTMAYATIHVTSTEIDIYFTDNVVTQLEALKAPYAVQAKLTVF